MINPNNIPCGSSIVFGRKARVVSAQWGNSASDSSRVEVIYEDGTTSEYIPMDDPAWKTAYYEGNMEREKKIHDQQQEIYELYGQIFSIRTEMMRYQNFRDQTTLQEAIKEANVFLATKKPIEGLKQLGEL